METQNLRKIKEKRGITLIALVITIIVLLILAGVSIATLTGQGNILENAWKAKENTQRANVIEAAQIDIFSEQQKTQDGNISTEKLREVLSKYFDDVPETDEEFEENSLMDPNYSLKSKSEYGGQDIVVADIYKGSFPEETYNPDDLTLGTLEAKNTDKYGWKVEKYDVQYNCGEDLSSTSNVWRLFYQDKKYTYLITDELVGKYLPSDYYDKVEYNGKYSDGTKMSIEGQKLNELATNSSLFTTDKTKKNLNIKATVWFTDTTNELWSQYKNEDAEFCMASPTAELYVASYNNNLRTSNKITVNFIPTSGYSLGFDPLRSVFSNGSHEIYYKGKDTVWWLASPGFGDPKASLTVYHVGGAENFHNCYVNSETNTFPIRPIVCMLTSKFKIKGYEASLVDE